MMPWHWRFRRPRALVRRLGLAPNRLHRPADHIESAVMVALLLTFLIGAPVLGLLVTRSSYESSLRAERVARHQATAQLTVKAPTPSPAFDDATPPTVPATARWTYAGGTHIGKVWVVPGADAGTKVTIWVDDHGRPATEQPSHVDTIGHAAVMGGSAVFGVAFVCWLLGLLGRRVFIRRQLAAWDAEWSAAEPRWSGRTGS